MKKQIVITGASGFIASEFSRYFANEYDFIYISRKSNPSKNIYSWDDLGESPFLIANASCVINLAGVNIGDKRWSKSRKQDILDSRIKTTEQLVALLNKLDNKPDLLCASAVGIYPTSGEFDEYYNIDFSHYANFCETVTKRWENTTKEYQGRVVNMRFGVVLSSHGGALTKILLPFKLGVGSGISDGQWSFSWISLPDLINAIDFLIRKNEIKGPINLVSPEIISYNKLIDTIVKIYNKKCWFNLPKWLVTIMFGQMGTELLLSGQTVTPKKLQEYKFSFKYPSIDSTINAIHLGEF